MSTRQRDRYRKAVSLYESILSDPAASDGVRVDAFKAALEELKHRQTYWQLIVSLISTALSIGALAVSIRTSIDAEHREERASNDAAIARADADNARKMSKAADDRREERELLSLVVQHQNNLWGTSLSPYSWSELVRRISHREKDDKTRSILEIANDVASMQASQARRQIASSPEEASLRNATDSTAAAIQGKVSMAPQTAIPAGLAPRPTDGEKTFTKPSASPASLLRVYPQAGSKLSESTRRAIVARLRAAGFPVQPWQVLGASVSFRNEVRYFFAEDAGSASKIAEALKETLGYAPAVRSMTNNGLASRAAPGLIEIWING